MREDTAEFFEALGRRGREPLLGGTRGSIRFEIREGDKASYWLVSVDKGDVTVSRRNRRADCTVRCAKQVFDGIVSGEVNTMAAILRGDVSVEGDPDLIVRFQRLFPGPPRGSAGEKER